MPFAFSTFALPILLGAALFIAVVFFSCNCLRRSPPPGAGYLGSVQPEKPKLWDLFIEVPEDAKRDELTTRWNHILPLSVERLGTTQWHTPGTRSAFALQQRLQGRKPEFGNISHLQIAVAIAMPSTRDNNMDAPTLDADDDQFRYCIGLQQTAVVGDLQ
ncbi:hypothetical protein FB45DRAFT_1056566 [Roridomyces roridus]|uniref:Uncharacterized protein n=1 Tax=Roridomyces roridus TaxID=1738132 RepID=A0AAD7FR19_9AGAR|nr:hypothetical protein FB45DRAFT_1056566 [Roridomyces roridus]